MSRSVPKPETREVGERYGIGQPIGEPTRVLGGLSHTLWLLTTDEGQYAVKVFNTSIDHLNVPNWKSQFTEAIACELAAWRAGIPMPRPVPVADDPDTMLADVTDTDGEPITIRLHEWVNGKPVGDDTTDPVLAARVGEIAARLHGLALPTRHGHPIGLDETEADGNLKALAKRARRAGFSWGDELDAARPAYQRIRDLMRVRYDRDWHLLATHRDFGPKNVLADAAGAPLVVDWDVAGPWTPEEETACAAMEFAGVLAGEPHRDCVTAFMSSYRSSGGQLDSPGPEMFAGWLVKLANWTEMHARHTVADPSAQTGSDIPGISVPFLLKLLGRMVTGVDEWADWLESS